MAQRRPVRPRPSSFRPLTLPDYFIDHDKPAKQIEMAGLSASHIVATAVSALGQSAVESPARA